MTNSLSKKRNYSLLLLVYAVSVIALTFIFTLGILISLFIAIPVAMVVIFVSPFITGTISGIIKGIGNEIRK